MVAVAPHSPKSTIKFLCSYGGKILPRYPDGKLRYLGGHTRVLSAPRSICFSELLLKMGDLCGSPVSLRCQLPAEDLDALVSITSDEDLANLIEEYDRVASPSSALKIRAFLSPPKSLSKVSCSSSSSSSSSLSLSKSSSSTSSSSSSSSSRSLTAACGCSNLDSSRRYPVMPATADRCFRSVSAPMRACPICRGKSSGMNIPLPHCAYHARRNSGHIYLIHNGNHWQ
ncbi:cell wall integrity and stress response component 1 [Neltuma alba]|uniref:cell wall integrity and stress response component 1 n=1 Tax=Neltuma alba TaxID=207710 RepID=UPI0010A3ED09|nr:cell wall integrity and stress response component 1-like [Prosopis alba]